MHCIGKDIDGITSYSLESLLAIKQENKILARVEIETAEDGWSFISRFVFSDNSCYEASGFSIGYGGEGPHGLHKAIRFFWPDFMPEDFYATEISQLRPKRYHKIIWTHVTGFYYIEELKE